jgi:hypothetical protein
MSNIEIINNSSQTSVVFIPEYIHKALLRNKFNTMDLKDYGKIREVLSLEDLATLEKFQSSEILAAYCGSSFQYSFKTPEEKNEFERSVVTLSKTEEIKSSITAYLRNESSLTSDKVPYQFIVLNDQISIIIGEGFLSHVEKSGNRLDFTKDILKLLYTKNSISNVSTTSTFKNYLLGLQKAVA